MERADNEMTNLRHGEQETECRTPSTSPDSSPQICRGKDYSPEYVKMSS